MAVGRLVAFLRPNRRVKGESPKDSGSLKKDGVHQTEKHLGEQAPSSNGSWNRTWNRPMVPEFLPETKEAKETKQTRQTTSQVWFELPKGWGHDRPVYRLQTDAEREEDEYYNIRLRDVLVEPEFAAPQTERRQARPPARPRVNSQPQARPPPSMEELRRAVARETLKDAVKELKEANVELDAAYRKLEALEAKRDGAGTPEERRQARSEMRELRGKLKELESIRDSVKGRLASLANRRLADLTNEEEPQKTGSESSSQSRLQSRLQSRPPTMEEVRRTVARETLKGAINELKAANVELDAAYRNYEALEAKRDGAGTPEERRQARSEMRELRGKLKELESIKDSVKGRLASLANGRLADLTEEEESQKAGPESSSQSNRRSGPP